jgi:hypothetical protein
MIGSESFMKIDRNSRKHIKVILDNTGFCFIFPEIRKKKKKKRFKNIKQTCGCNLILHFSIN